MRAAEYLQDIKDSWERLRKIEAAIAELRDISYIGGAPDAVRVQTSYTESRVEKLAIKREELRTTYAEELGALFDKTTELSKRLEALSSYRQMGMLHSVYCLGKSVKETAARYDCTVSCVHTTIKNGKKALDEIYQGK